MREHQRAPRGGGQPEGSVDDPRDEADPRPRSQQSLSTNAGVLLLHTALNILCDKVVDNILLQ